MKKLSKNIRLYLLIAAILCIGLVGFVFAKYVGTPDQGVGQFSASNFYFTANILGDTAMTNCNNEFGQSYAFSSGSTEGTWQLYGGGEHSIEITLQNYYDALRVNEEAIQYKAEVSVELPDGYTHAYSVNNVSLSKKSGMLAGGSGSEQTIVLTIPELRESDAASIYDDHTVVTLKIESTLPYKKVLTLHFELFTADAILRYRIVDSVKSPFAELILMTGTGKTEGTETIMPILHWPDSLAIDNTNKLTYTISDEGTITQQTMTQDASTGYWSMKISEAMIAGRSESIFFFKQNINMDYSKPDTVVQQSGEDYIIRISG